MKILFDHQIFSNQTYGGISRYIVELAKSITNISNSPKDICIMAPLYRNIYLSKSKDKINTFGLHIPDIPKTGRIINYVNNSISKRLLTKNKYEIIHETYYSEKDNYNNKGRLVLTVHDMIHELFPQHFSSNDITRQKKELAIKRADHIICISESTKTDLIKLLRIDEKKISVVHHGIAPPVTASDSFAKPIKPFILYVGQRNGYKNFSGLILAYSMSKKIHDNYDLVCFGGGKFSNTELNYFNFLKLNISKIHQITGDDSILSSYYRYADAFVYPSLYEGFGIPLLEAMSYNCPIACSNTSSIPEIAGDAAVLFNPNSVNSLSDSLHEILFNSVIRKRIVENGRLQIKKYSWERCADNTYKAYQKSIE